LLGYLPAGPTGVVSRGIRQFRAVGSEYAPRRERRTSPATRSGPWRRRDLPSRCSRVPRANGRSPASRTTVPACRPTRSAACSTASIAAAQRAIGSAAANSGCL